MALRPLSSWWRIGLACLAARACGAPLRYADVPGQSLGVVLDAPRADDAEQGFIPSASSAQVAACHATPRVWAISLGGLGRERASTRTINPLSRCRPSFASQDAYSLPHVHVRSKHAGGISQLSSELEAAARALDDANATLAQALALDAMPTNDAAGIEEQLRAAAALEHAAEAPQRALLPQAVQLAVPLAASPAPLAVSPAPLALAATDATEPSPSPLALHALPSTPIPGPAPPHVKAVKPLDILLDLARPSPAPTEPAEPAAEPAATPAIAPAAASAAEPVASPSPAATASLLNVGAPVASIL